MIVEEPKENKEVTPRVENTPLIPNEEKVRISNLFDDVRFLNPTDVIPVDTPVRPLDKFRLYVSGSTTTLYVWDSSTSAWLSVSLGGGGGTTIAGRMTNSAGQTISNTTDTVVTFNTSEIEEGITCDLTNEQFEILTDGIYLITAQVSYTDPVSGKIIQAIIQDDIGTYLAQSQWITSSTDMLSVNVSYMGSFSVGDKIQLHTYHNCGGNETIQSGLNTFFQIQKV